MLSCVHVHYPYNWYFFCLFFIINTTKIIVKLVSNFRLVLDKCIDIVFYGGNSTIVYIIVICRFFHIFLVFDLFLLKRYWKLMNLLFLISFLGRSIFFATFRLSFLRKDTRLRRSVFVIEFTISPDIQEHWWVNNEFHSTGFKKKSNFHTELKNIFSKSTRYI